MDNTILKKIISYLIIASIFITGEGLIDVGFLVYWYYPLYLAVAIYGIFVWRKINVKALTVFVLIVLYSLLTYKLGLSFVLKQIVNIGFSGIVFYYFIWHENFDLEELFRKYTVFSKIVLVIGFVQVFLFSIGLGSWFIACFPYLNIDNTTFRLQSVTQEPSSIAFTFAPVVFLSLYNLFYWKCYLINKKWSLLFLIGYLLTQSSVAYIGILCMLSLLYFKNFTYRKLQLAFFAFAGIAMIGYAAYRFIPFIKIRVDDTIYGISNDFTAGDTYLRVNISTYALLSNYYVARRSFEENPLTGNGLGTHELVYDRFIPPHMRAYFSLNRQDANSMGLRLVSETGLVGLFAFCFFTIKYKLKSRPYFSDKEEIMFFAKYCYT